MRKKIIIIFSYLFKFPLPYNVLCAPQKSPYNGCFPPLSIYKFPLYQFEASYPFLFLLLFQDVLWWGIELEILSTLFWKLMGSFSTEMRWIIACVHKVESISVYSCSWEINTWFQLWRLHITKSQRDKERNILWIEVFCIEIYNL